MLDVVGDVAAGEFPKGLTEVAGEDLDGHSRLLLPDAGECIKSASQIDGRRASASVTTLTFGWMITVSMAVHS